MENFNLDDFDRMLFGQNNTRTNAGDLKCPICNQSQRTKGWLNWHIRNKKCRIPRPGTRELDDNQDIRLDYMTKKYFTEFFTYKKGVERIMDWEYYHCKMCKSMIHQLECAKRYACIYNWHENSEIRKWDDPDYFEQELG